MNSDGNIPGKKHSLITRPVGLPGYAPKAWCAVCGKTTANLSTQNCVTTDCPNVCHTDCLNGEENFNCFNVDTLRSAFHIPDAISYVENSDNVNTPENYFDNELENLEKNELLAMVKKLQADIVRKNSILSFFSTTTADLANKRDAVVSVLDFIDNLLATKTSLEELEVNSIACSACPENIYEDGQSAVESDENLKSWWESGKPKKLKRTCFTGERNDLLILFRKNRARTIVEVIKGNTISQIINHVKIKIEDSIYIHRIINIVSYKSRNKDPEITDILSLIIHQEIFLTAAFKIEENQTLFLEDKEN